MSEGTNVDTTLSQPALHWVRFPCLEANFTVRAPSAEDDFTVCGLSSSSAIRVSGVASLPSYTWSWSFSPVEEVLNIASFVKSICTRSPSVAGRKMAVPVE